MFTVYGQSGLRKFRGMLRRTGARGVSKLVSLIYLSLVMLSLIYCHTLTPAHNIHFLPAIFVQPNMYMLRLTTDPLNYFVSSLSVYL